MIVATLARTARFLSSLASSHACPGSSASTIPSSAVPLLQEVVICARTASSLPFRSARAQRELLGVDGLGGVKRDELVKPSAQRHGLRLEPGRVDGASDLASFLAKSFAEAVPRSPDQRSRRRPSSSG